MKDENQKTKFFSFLPNPFTLKKISARSSQIFGCLCLKCKHTDRKSLPMTALAVSCDSLFLQSDIVAHETGCFSMKSIKGNLKKSIKIKIKIMCLFDRRKTIWHW